MFEIDAQGHLAGSAYIDYANQALWEHLRFAGIDIDAMLASGAGPVNLETNIRFLSELRAGDTVTLACQLTFTPGKKSYRVQVEFLRGDTLAAQVVSIYGLLDLHERRLIDDPAERWRKLASHPERLGLSSVQAT